MRTDFEFDRIKTESISIFVPHSSIELNVKLPDTQFFKIILDDNECPFFPDFSFFTENFQ